MSGTATPATVTGPEATVFNYFPTREDLARRISQKHHDEIAEFEQIEYMATDPTACLPGGRSRSAILTSALVS